ncbi:MAG: molybdenum cofactor guanylyltransferase [Cyanobacteria bacterium]|jgi:molybdopterin-guanine dinucleotide biosynthesis protein A|nr:molybdenum cofactor guanylyltransferase [Cyanobacteria bacterium GSL.Bin21]
MSIVLSSETDLSAIILAGGYSQRMGEDKAFMKVAGMPLLQRTCQLAQALTSQVYIVTPWGDRYQEILPCGCRVIPETVAAEEPPSHGPLVGLYQGLQAVQTSWVLALACDLPKLTVSELEFWWRQLEEMRAEKVALLPKSPQGWEPLAGFYHRNQCTALFATYLADGKRSFQGFLDQHPVQELTVRDRATLFNCNTPADRQQISSFDK